MSIRDFLMVENREKEWQQLEERAMYLLKNPDALSKAEALKTHKLYLRLWQYHSFEPYKVWLIYLGRDEKTLPIINEACA